MGQRNALAELLSTKPQQPSPNSLAALVGDAAANVRAGVGTAQAREPSWRERTGGLLQDALEKLAVDRYGARKIAQTVVGGESSNLPLRMGLLDPTAVGALFARQESPNMGPGAPSGMLAATLPARPAAASLEDLAEAWKAQGVKLDAYASKAQPGVVTLSRLVVPKEARGQGVGTQVMDDLVRYADQTGQTIALTPSTDFGASSVSRLRDFYRRFGFVDNKGRSQDFTLSETMYRAPLP